jgi:acyl-CoA thioesterase-1
MAGSDIRNFRKVKMTYRIFGILAHDRRLPDAYGRGRPFRPIIFAGRLFEVLLALLVLVWPAAAAPLHLVALGDSLTAGYSLSADAAFPAQLSKALGDKGYAVEIDNAGVSGDTSSGALARLDWALGGGADGVILEIGANDMLRGQDPGMTEANIDAIMARLQARKIPVFLAGMRAAPNLGADFGGKFDAIYPKLAKKYDAPLYPFFLEGVSGHPGMQLPDGMHPTREGVAVIVKGMMPQMTTWLDGLRKK